MGVLGASVADDVKCADVGTLCRLQHVALQLTSQLCAACGHMCTVSAGYALQVNRLGRRVCTGGDCDLVTPQSTVKGKGYWGEVEGLEVQLHLNASGDDFVNNPLNFRRVQVRVCTQFVRFKKNCNAHAIAQCHWALHLHPLSMFARDAHAVGDSSRHSWL